MFSCHISSSVCGLTFSGLPLFGRTPTRLRPAGPIRSTAARTRIAGSEQSIAISEVIGYADHRLKDSPDGQYHWCTIGGSEQGATICLFVPPHSF